MSANDPNGHPDLIAGAAFRFGVAAERSPSKPWPRRCQQPIELLVALDALTPLVALLRMEMSTCGTFADMLKGGTTSASDPKRTLGSWGPSLPE